MIVDEQSRNDLYAGLAEVLGPDRATVLMAHLSPLPWSDLATKADMVALRGDFDALRDDFGSLRGEFENLRTDTKADIAVLRGDLENHRTETKADMAALRGDLENLRVATKADLDSAVSTIRIEIGASENRISSDIHRVGWKVVFAVLTTFIALASVFTGMFIAVA